MTLRERWDLVTRAFQFRAPDGRFRADRRGIEEAIRGEVAFADPRRLFPGNAPYTTYNPSTLVGVKGLHLFDEMKRDDQVKSALMFKKHAVITSGWQVSSPEGQPKDWEP